MKKVLVTYATQHQATAEIAAAIGEELRRVGGLQVDVRPVDQVKSVEAYDAVVLGSAVYIGQWRPEAADFLTIHEKALAGRPVWLFSSGPTGQGDPKTLLKGWKFPEALQPVAARIAPRDIALFHGKLQSNQLNFLQRLMIRFVKAPIGDFRDWTMIRSWAGSIAHAL